MEISDTKEFIMNPLNTPKGTILAGIVITIVLWLIVDLSF